jgi:hypothetical protein
MKRTTPNRVTFPNCAWTIKKIESDNTPNRKTDDISFSIYKITTES